jgi:hypothetical protein
MIKYLSEEPYRFPYMVLAWTLTVAILGVILFPWAMLCYKIWHGNKEIDEDFREELLTRSWRVGWRVTLAAPVFVLADYFCSSDAWLGFPPGPVHLVFLLAFIPLVAWAMMYCFSLEDFFQGLAMAIFFLYVPAAIFAITWGHRWNLLFVYVLSWLKDPKV